MTLRSSLLALAAVAVACHRSPRAAPAPAQGRALLLDPSASYWQTPAPAVYDARVVTTKGTFVIEVDRAWAPRGADQFYRLARAEFFDDSRFFRVVPHFIVQFGLPGDPRLATPWVTRTILDDSVRQSNTRGTIAFAMTGPNARATQLYINLVDNARLDAQGFAPIGRVISGMDVVDAIYSGYGENSGGGVRAGKQAPVIAGGNAYLDREYPKLDHLVRITIIDRK